MKRKKNLTIAMDDDLATKLKVVAATERKSLSRFIADFLREHLKFDQEYHSAMNSYFERGDFLDSKKSAYPKRDELYE